MDFDALLNLLGALLLWRVLLSLVVASVLGFALVYVLPWFTGFQGIAIAILGLGAGLIWESYSTTPQGSNQTPAAETTPFVTGLAAALAGAIWGVISSSTSHSFVAGLLILVPALWSWYWYVSTFKSTTTKGIANLCVILASTSYLFSAGIANIAR
jgi:hypothetical protein